MHTSSVVETIQVLVVMVPLVLSNVVRIGISYECVQRTCREMIMREIEPNLCQLLHQTWLHLQEPLLVLVEGKTTSMQSLTANNKRTL